MEFRLLGALEVDSAGVDLTPARAKQRMLLALLLLPPGAVVAADDLIDALWGERPPETARKALHGHVSALRKRLGAERIVTGSGGYCFRLGDDDQLDVDRFERLVAEARVDRPLARSRKLAEALALFRGDALADFRYEEFAAPEATRLEELRLAALEEQIDAEIELSRHLEAIPRLEALIAEHPYRERLRAQLMLALYRAGRQADALEAFRLARHALVTELGIEPSAALLKLEHQILNHDRRLAAPEAFARAHDGADAPTTDGIVTFLFADAPANRALVQTVAAQYSGVEVTSDAGSLLVAFARARDAAAAAVAAQRMTACGISVGLHSAEAIVTRDGYAGPGPRGAATVCSGAHAGQILLSRTARDLLRETPLEEVGVRDLGHYRLQDLAPPWRLFQLVAPGVPREFPPPRSLETHATNLPSQPTPLIGRDRELRELGDLLRRAEMRLVTLTGAAGIGKTRLAVQAAAKLLDAFADGVFFVELAPLADPELVLPTLAEVLGIREATGRDRAEQLRRRLSGRRSLLVLDNFEHLLDASPALADVVTSISPSTVLVTSRIPLGIDVEHVYGVPPLATPAVGKRDHSHDRLMQVDSVALFASRAQAVRPDFTVTAENAGAVARICRSLDGLPLAIELAAARVGVLPPAALLRRLDRRLTLLGRSADDVPERHRTLRAAIGWSYDLLRPEQQALFRRLAVFAGGCTLEAAEAICGEGLDVVDGLASLVDANLVRQEGADDEPRFAFPETTREYAAEHLDESGEGAEVRRRHAAYYLGVAEQSEPHLRESPGEWLERLEREHDNLRTALDRLEAADEPELLLRLGGALWRFWYLKAHLAEGRRRLETALALGTGATAARAKALIGLTVLTGNTGNFPRARKTAEEAIALNEALGDDWGAAYATHMLGAALLEEGELAEAELLFEQSTDAFRRLGDQHSAFLVTRNLARLLDRRGERERERALHEDTLRLAQETHNPRIEASTLGALAIIAARDGRSGDAMAMLRRSLRIHRDLGDLLDSAVDLCRCAFVLACNGRTETAARLLSSFDDLRDDIGARGAWVATMNEETLTIVRKDLDEAALEDARERAHEMTLDDALALAISALPEGDVTTLSSAKTGKP